MQAGAVHTSDDYREIVDSLRLGPFPREVRSDDVKELLT